jgi:hypothetical protein
MHHSRTSWEYKNAYRQVLCCIIQECPKKIRMLVGKSYDASFKNFPSSHMQGTVLEDNNACRQVL